MIEWTDAQIRILIDEHRNRNEEYHNLGRNRTEFWASIATELIEITIRALMGTNSMCEAIEEHEEAGWARNILTNSVHIFGRGLKMISKESAKYRRVIEEAGEHLLIVEEVEVNLPIHLQTVMESSLIQKNPGVENPEQNIGHASSIEVSSLQPLPYEARDETQNNVGGNSSHNIDNIDDTNENLDDLTDITSTLNISASQNNSDLSMPDIEGGSQPPSYMESINEES
ncbi:2534_t:CDS:2 [Ambispora leptoticha]|uniref:2534_t:CDS:1 n=1 Tax=Ambispora leptoticha TaxID=144679 RepID=A0A9N9BSA3_9GLOM|nr:2534_t:CDS:2 [Ambispora leptoticha]